MTVIAIPALAETRLDHFPAMPSHYVEARDITVWAPDTCRPIETARVPLGQSLCSVLYVMDGQNVFTPSVYSGEDWGLAEAIPRLMREGKIPPTVVVAINATHRRTQEYMPQGVYDRVPPTYQARIRKFSGGDPPSSDAFLHFLVKELKPFIDRTYLTDRSRNSTAIMGASMGGHIALYAHGEYPDVFCASASLSMPWLMADWARDPLALSHDRAMITSGWRDWFLATRLTPERDRIYTDQGTIGLDAEFTPYMEDVTTMLLNRGWTGDSFTSRVFTGAEHSERDWRRRIDVPLTYVLGCGDMEKGSLAAFS